jgi:hypothetical protein
MDVESGQGISWGYRAFRYRRIVKIAQFFVTFPLRVAHVLPQNDVFPFDDFDASQHFHFFVSYVVGVARRGFLHRDKSENLQKMILHNIPNNTKFVEISATALGTEWFFKTDLYRSDVVSVPSWVENSIPKSAKKSVTRQLSKTGQYLSVIRF